MKRRPTTVLRSLLLLLCLPAAAQQVPRDPLAGDPRLLQHVEATAEGLAIADLLSLLSRETGVSLATDRQTADEKVILFSPPRPLRDLLADLAALFNDRWTRKDGRGGRPAYTLTRDVRAAQYEARLARAATDRAMAQLEEQVRALAETPEQLARRSKNDPIRQFLSDDVGRLGTMFYAALSKEQRDLLFARGRLSIPFSALGPQHQAPLRKAFADRVSVEQEFSRQLLALDPKRHVTVHQAEELDTGSLRFRVQRVGGSISVGLDLGARPFAAAVSQDESGHPQLAFSGWPIALLDGHTGWLLPPHGNPYIGEKIAADAALPGAAAARAAAAAKNWTDRLRRLATQAGVAVMADYYRGGPVAGPPATAPPTPEPDTATAALDALCESESYLWWVRGKTLLLRKRNWYEQRLYEVPDRWMLELIERLKTHDGIPTRGDVTRVLDLTTEQIAGLNALARSAYVYDDDSLMGARELLAILKASPPGADGPIPANGLALTLQTLTPLQRSLLPAFLEALDHPVTTADAAGFRAHLFRPSDPPSATASGYRSVPVRAEWRLGQEAEPRTVTLFLPLSLPDDRRPATKIAVLP